MVLAFHSSFLQTVKKHAHLQMKIHFGSHSHVGQNMNPKRLFLTQREVNDSQKLNSQKSEKGEHPERLLNVQSLCAKTVFVSSCGSRHKIETN